MCGITGLLGKPDQTKKHIDKMVDIINHRGPDDRGVHIDSDFAFGMRRLSIIDINHGHQPIWNEDATVGVVFNGEIYNHRSFRPDLISLGHKFKTESDTEALVHLYEQYSTEMLKKLRGMFGFCIYDKKKNQLFIARDFFGIKPIYYRMKKDRNGQNKIISFGSEIKSLLVDQNFKPEVNHDAVTNYLSFQYNPLEETMFKDIFRLLPGHYMMVDLKTHDFTVHPYWHYKFDDKHRWDDTDEMGLAEEIQKVIKESVEHHMISDVPVGSFLSGGIDSAIIVSTAQDLMAKQSRKPLSTFTIGFDHISETNEARQISDSKGTDHHEITVDFKSYFDELPKIAWHFDEPVADPSAVALYFLAKEAGKKVKVVMSGEGADELFGGYNIYREPFDIAIVDKLPSFIKKYILKPISKIPLNIFGLNFIKRAVSSVEERYIGNAYIFKPREVKKILLDKAKWNDSRISLDPYYQSVKNQTDSRKMQYIDINFWLPGDILAKADKMTMAHSLELRVPFLDIQVAKISSKIPDKLKYKNKKTKYILRKAFENVLPKETAERKKLGFPTPLKIWLRENPAKIKEMILSNVYIKNHMDTPYIEKLIENHTAGYAENSRKIYVLLMLALWYNVYIDKSIKIH
jgi:asparagine synthase (glutamine-hydrolysing)